MKDVKCIIILLIFASYALPRYNQYLPTLPLYPDSYKEADLVKRLMDQRTMEERELFQLTDPSVSHAFSKYVNETIEELDLLITRPKIIYPIYFFKYLLNRPRPFQINPMIVPAHSMTAHTPAFPSGHAYQAHYLAKVLSEKYPHKRDILEDLAHKCSYSRIAMGLHYPSDNRFSKSLVDIFY